MNEKKYFFRENFQNNFAVLFCNFRSLPYSEVTPKSNRLQKGCSLKGLFKIASCQKGYTTNRVMRKAYLLKHVVHLFK